MQLLILILFWLTFGGLTAQIAKNKGRDPRLWFFIGVLLGIVGVAVALFLPKKKQQNDLLWQQTNTHIEKQPAVQPAPQIPAYEDTQWFYLDQAHQQYGPVFLSNLKELYKNRQINDQTYIWTEGMENWKRLHEHTQFNDFLKV